MIRQPCEIRKFVQICPASGRDSKISSIVADARLYTVFDRIQHLYICCTGYLSTDHPYEKYRASGTVSQGGAVPYGQTTRRERASDRT